MRNFLYTGFLGLLLLSACNNSNKNKNGETADSANVHTELSDSFYKRLEGTIAGKPVVMHLQRVDGDYSGVYYYSGAWLRLSTDTIVSKDSVVLLENGFYDSYVDKDAKQSRIGLKWTGNGFTGNWKNDKDNKSFPVVLKENYPDGSYQFAAGRYQDSVKAEEKNQKSPVAEISVTYLQPKENNANASWLDSELKRIAGLDSVNGDRKAGFANISSAYFADYKSQIADQQKDGPDRGFMQWMNYTNNSAQSLAYNDNGYVVIDYFVDAYTGGAHGNYASTMYCLDVKNKRRMALRDVVEIDSNTLQRILEKNLRKNYHIKSGDPISTVLFDDFIKPNDNFYFNSFGLAFMYNPYEVASYAQGQIVVFIPYADLKGYLKRDFTKRMKIG
ncbi:RsiV family protein [Pedobacter endophyticus]|uniref:DUF3298 domain-containing protein n=1 Tax=Pedobacter endophyticus TaxID=2789740 RepID=A0A7S9PZT0_9SPHI|nr:RsiV family protein [Pedobacter endophyticus]QPH40673.1 DUF3298 domain-containing protein [Pedobacter endophyticus]